MLCFHSNCTVLKLIWFKQFHRIGLQSGWRWPFSHLFTLKSWLKCEDLIRLPCWTAAFIGWICEWVNRSSGHLAQRPGLEDSARAPGQMDTCGARSQRLSRQPGPRFLSELTLCSRNSSNEGFSSAEIHHLLTKNRNTMFWRKAAELGAGHHHTPPATSELLLPGTLHFVSSGPALSSSRGVDSFFFPFVFNKVKEYSGWECKPWSQPAWVPVLACYLLAMRSQEGTWLSLSPVPLR